MICFDPDKTCDVWLDGDADKPEGDRPTFAVRVLTARQFDRLLNSLDDASLATNRLASIERTLGQCVAGWRNLPAEYDGSVDPLLDWMTLPELNELVAKAINVQTLSRQDLGKSASQSGSNSASSAVAVTVGSVESN